MGKAQNVAALNCLMEFQHPHCIYIDLQRPIKNKDLQRPIKNKEAVKNANIRTNSKDHIDL
jgi:hypothetical protein